jgi:hypothetical protein
MEYNHIDRRCSIHCAMVCAPRSIAMGQIVSENEKRLSLAALLLALAVGVGMWGGIAYVIMHFILRYW